MTFIRGSRTGWVPSGRFHTQVQRLALGVEAIQNPGQQLWRHLLTSRLQSLIDADPRRARLLLAASCENSPEMFAISQEVNVEHWGIAIAQSEAVSQLTRQVEWHESGDLVLTDLLLPLDEFVESLP